MRTRAYRRHQRARTKARHLCALRVSGISSVPRPRDIAVRHPSDCGGRCLLCHWSKFLDPRRARERREWLREVGQGDGCSQC